LSIFTFQLTTRAAVRPRRSPVDDLHRAFEAKRTSGEVNLLGVIRTLAAARAEKSGCKEVVAAATGMALGGLKSPRTHRPPVISMPGEAQQ
jgi:hypothetical protein